MQDYGDLLPKDDPNSIGQMLSRITDDQGRSVYYWLDESGKPYLVRCHQAFDSGLNLVNYQQTAYTDENSTGNNPYAWLTTLANTWNSRNQYGQRSQSTLVQNDYTMDNGGQRLNNTITSSSGARTEQYSYDELNRLKTVDYGDGQTQGYAFDAKGNRSSKADTGGGINGTEGYTYNAANMLLSRAGNAYTNDAAGNTLTGGGRTNTWDSQNRLCQCVHGVDTSTFAYGADGIRRQSTVNGTATDFVLDASMFIRERRAGANIATYLVGARGPEYRRDDVSGTVRWYLYDGLGSVLGEVDPAGTITGSRKYDVYGLVRSGTNPGGTSKHKFVGSLGHPSEDETGLTYMRARYYDPNLGRFVSQDPRLSGENWYVYANDNPVNYSDGDGRSAIGCFIIGFILGFLISCMIYFSQTFSWHSFLNVLYTSFAGASAGLGATIGVESAFATGGGGIAAELVNGVSGGLLGFALFMVGSYVAMITVLCLLDVLEEVLLNNPQPVQNAPSFDWGFR